MPTRYGWGVAITGLICLVAGRVFGPIEFFVMGSAAVAAVVIACLVRRLRPSHLAIARTVSPVRVAAGGSARVDLEVLNRNYRRSPVLRLTDHVSGTRGARLALGPIEVSAATTAAYRLPTTRRGVLEIGPVLVEDSDALGLARRVHRVESKVRLIVHPEIEPLPPIRVPAGDDPTSGDELRQSLGMSTEEFDGLREYVSGDDLRRIHWPSSARHDELLVRQFRPPRHGRLTIIIDTRPPGDTDEVLDRTTSIAASIGIAVLGRNDAVRIQTTDGRETPFVSGRGQTDTLLEFLALLSGGSETISPGLNVSGGTVIAISHDPKLATDATIRAAFVQRLRAKLLLTCDVETWGQGKPGAASAGWLHLTGPGQLGTNWSLPTRATAAAR